MLCVCTVQKVTNCTLVSILSRGLHTPDCAGSPTGSTLTGSGSTLTGSGSTLTGSGSVLSGYGWAAASCARLRLVERGGGAAVDGLDPAKSKVLNKKITKSIHRCNRRLESFTPCHSQSITMADFKENHTPRWNFFSRTQYFLKVSRHKLKSFQTRVFVWFSTLSFPFRRCYSRIEMSFLVSRILYCMYLKKN